MSDLIANKSLQQYSINLFTLSRPIRFETNGIPQNNCYAFHFQNFFAMQRFQAIQKRFKFEKPKIHGLLLKDVPNVGQKGDIIMTTVSTMRNVLVPLKQAYYLPRFMGKPILPDDWKLPVSTLDLKLEQITPAFEKVPYQEFIRNTEDNTSDEALKNKLSSIKLSFKRILVHKDSNKIFGSVSAQDIQQELNKMGIPIDIDRIQCRIKNIGDHLVSISLGQEIAELNVHVEQE